MAICNYGLPGRQKHESNLNKLFAKWSSHKWIRKRFEDKHAGYDELSSKDAMEWYLSQRLKLPIQPDFSLSEGEVRRAFTEIDAFGKRVKGGFWNLPFVVPEGTSKQDPASRKFYLELNNILNYERTNLNSNLEANARISNLLFDAYASKGLSRRDAIKNIKELRKDLMQDDGMNVNKWVDHMEKFLAKDVQGELLKEFIELVHMDNNKFSEVRADKDTMYSGAIYEAVKEARKQLDNLGNVYKNGLTRLKRLAAIRYTNQPDPLKAVNMSKRYRVFSDKIDSSINAITEGQKKGGYFPHLKFQSLLHIKEQLMQSMTGELTREGSKMSFERLADRILGEATTNDIPDHAKLRNEAIDQYWNKDPIFVLEQYGAQAAQFNKLVATQLTTLEALKNIPVNNDMEYISGMKRFIAEEYAVFTKGMMGRNEWANKTVRVLNGLQTARTMGLNITGAIKNAASAIHYYSHAGFGAIRDTRAAMQSDNFRKIVQRVEKEAGFKFKDVAPELYSEGTFKEADFKREDIQFDPISGKIKYQDEPIMNFLKDSSKKSLNFLLFFHRLTENSQRKWMFRTAFHLKYNQLLDRGYSAGKAEQFAKEHGLMEVNRWAYEYSPHAKSKWVRGEGRVIEEMEGQDMVITKKLTADAKGASQEVIFHLLHYPSSLFETHFSQLSGAKKALLSKQWDADELQYLMRYAGISSLIGLVSALTNVDLTNIIENESIERVERVVSDLTEFDNSQRSTFGLLSEFTGPTVGTMKYLGIAGGLINTDTNDFNKIVFGNVDYSDISDENVARFSSYQLSTEYGMLKHKIIPAMKSRRGIDILRHTFKMYPSEFTKKYSEKIWGLSDSKLKKRQKKGPVSGISRIPAPIHASLKALEEKAKTEDQFPSPQPIV